MPEHNLGEFRLHTDPIEPVRPAFSSWSPESRRPNPDPFTDNQSCASSPTLQRTSIGRHVTPQDPSRKRRSRTSCRVSWRTWSGDASHSQRFLCPAQRSEFNPSSCPSAPRFETKSQREPEQVPETIGLRALLIMDKMLPHGAPRRGYVARCVADGRSEFAGN